MTWNTLEGSWALLEHIDLAVLYWETGVGMSWIWGGKIPEVLAVGIDWRMLVHETEV